MNSRKALLAHTKPVRAVAVDIRPRASTTQDCKHQAFNSLIHIGRKFGRLKRIEMTSNDLKEFGNALFVEPAPAPNAALISIMRQAKAWK